MKKLHWIHTKKIPVFEQLQLEEALLRTAKDAYCWINEGSSKAIVMGSSLLPEKWLHLHTIKNQSIPVIKRFSAGGSVVVDEDTLFITFIFPHHFLDIRPFPEPILHWTGNLYQKAWKIPGFSVVENDYVIAQKKCGGNAQYIQKNRWLHHTSFLWDYNLQNMHYLLFPPTVPQYRKKRSHAEFLCKLKEVVSEKKSLVDQLKNELLYRFEISEIDYEKTLKEFLKKPHRKTTKILR